MKIWDFIVSARRNLRKMLFTEKEYQLLEKNGELSDAISVVTLRNIDVLSIPFAISPWGIGFKDILASISNEKSQFLQTYYPSKQDREWINSWSSDLKDRIIDDYGHFVGILEGLKKNLSWWALGAAVRGGILGWNILAYSLSFYQIYKNLSEKTPMAENFKNTLKLMGMPDISLSLFTFAAAILINQKISATVNQWPGAKKTLSTVCSNISSKYSPFDQYDLGIFCTISKASKIVDTEGKKLANDIFLILAGAIAGLWKTTQQYYGRGKVVTQQFKVIKKTTLPENMPILPSLNAGSSTTYIQENDPSQKLLRAIDPSTQDGNSFQLSVVVPAGDLTPGA